ncbi:Meiosis-specific protein ASY3 [Bienertia sinuspersici]
MTAAKGSGKKRSEADALQSDKRKRDLHEDEDIFDNELSSEIKGIMSALQQIREKAEKDGQKKKEETISSVAAEIKSIFEELKTKIEKDSFVKELKECENALKEETVKFQEVYEKFSKEKATYVQALKDTISKYEEEKERLSMRYEQQRKKEKNLIQEKEKVCNDKIADLEESLKKKKQGDKTFSLLRKTLGSFLETGSDEEYPPDD